MDQLTPHTNKLNLPFVGFCTFAKSPIVEQESDYQADFAVIGAPFDMGCQYRSGARFGPRAIRQASTLFSFGHKGAYDHELDVLFLEKDAVKIVDLGDVDMVHTDTTTCLNNIEKAVRSILDNNAIPVILGEDHAITAATIAAYDDQEPMHVVQIDAHLDFVDERHGVRYGHGNCMRRASEMPHVTGISQLGIRNVSSSSQSDYTDARAAGSNIVSVRQFRQSSIREIVEQIPKGGRCYITIDIDGFDPAIAPGTGTPSHGGFDYYEVLEFFHELTQHVKVVGIDLCEVSPPYDPAEVTSTLAAQLLMNLIGYVSHYDAQGEAHV